MAMNGICLSRKYQLALLQYALNAIAIIFSLSLGLNQALEEKGIGSSREGVELGFKGSSLTWPDVGLGRYGLLRCSYLGSYGPPARRWAEPNGESLDPVEMLDSHIKQETPAYLSCPKCGAKMVKG